MSGPLFPTAPPSVTRLVVAWLAAEFGVGAVGSKRPQAGVLPYRMVTVVAGTENSQKWLQCATVSVHTFAADMDSAEYEASLTHERMLLMGPPFAGYQDISYSIPTGDTVTASPRSVVTKAIPTYLSYEDELIYRFYARYEVDVRFQ